MNGDRALIVASSTWPDCLSGEDIARDDLSGADSTPDLRPSVEDLVFAGCVRVDDPVDDPADDLVVRIAVRVKNAAKHPSRVSCLFKCVLSEIRFVAG
ncbi:MAG: hypothetical protein ACREDR_19240 [Blastocatellia bacterium]